MSTQPYFLKSIPFPSLLPSFNRHPEGLLKDSSVGTSASQTVLLAPRNAFVPPNLRQVDVNPRLHRHLLAEVQRFRGRIYYQDSAIQESDLTSDGRHVAAADDRSWHVLSMRGGGSVTGCFRFIEESVTASFDSLWLHECALAYDDNWGWKLRHAVRSEMESAARQGLTFGEVGGWAIAPERRWTNESVRSVMSAYALLQLMGGGIALATATFRHNSAGVLQRMGFTPLSYDGEQLPPYYDPAYGCEMQVLRFDSRQSNPKYMGMCANLQAELGNATVVTSSLPAYSPVGNFGDWSALVTAGSRD